MMPAARPISWIQRWKVAGQENDTIKSANTSCELPTNTAQSVAASHKHEAERCMKSVASLYHIDFDRASASQTPCRHYNHAFVCGIPLKAPIIAETGMSSIGLEVQCDSDSAPWKASIPKPFAAEQPNSRAVRSSRVSSGA